MTTRGGSAVLDDTVDDRNAQIPVLPGGFFDRVISDPLLPFPVGPGTGEGRRDRPFLKQPAYSESDQVETLGVGR
jgi:hypothetical protein